MIVSFTLNGRSRTVDIEPSALVADLLRENLNLTGTHVGCDTSQCGACVVLFNGEAVQMFHQPAAHTDGDILVHFRHADVVSTGDLFTTTMYPFIDDANGGTIDGYIRALNNIITITVPSNVNEGGTMVIPGHGRLSDEQGVIEYRDMVTIIRDRILEYVKRGMTLDQVKAKKPTLDFEPRYGSDEGFWTTSMFIEVIYKQMLAANPPAKTAKPAAPAKRGNK